MLVPFDLDVCNLFVIANFVVSHQPHAPLGFSLQIKSHRYITVNNLPVNNENFSFYYGALAVFSGWWSS